MIFQDALPAHSEASESMIRRFPPSIQDHDVFNDLVWGYLSGFPYCCIRWYVTVWMPAVRRQRRGDVQRIGDWEELVAIHPQREHVGYVQCPTCVEAG